MDVLGKEEYINFLKNKNTNSIELPREKAYTSFEIISPDGDILIKNKNHMILEKDSSYTFGEFSRGTVKVKYINKKGKEIKTSDTIADNKPWSEIYEITPPKTIKKYVYESSDAPLKNIVGEGEKIVTLTYSGIDEDDLAKLSIKYIDIDTNQIIKNDTSENKELGSSYSIIPAQIDKYDYVESSDALTGTINAPKEVTLKYRKKSKTINVKYVDENGREIKNSTLLTKKN